MKAKKGERIDHQICSFLWKGWRQDRVPRVRRIGLVEGRSRENKGKQGGHGAREREKEKSYEMKRREEKQAATQREKEILTHGRIRRRMQWWKNKKN